MLFCIVSHVCSNVKHEIVKEIYPYCGGEINSLINRHWSFALDWSDDVSDGAPWILWDTPVADPQEDGYLKLKRDGVCLYCGDVLLWDDGIDITVFSSYVQCNWWLNHCYHSTGITELLILCPGFAVGLIGTFLVPVLQKNKPL